MSIKTRQTPKLEEVIADIEAVLEDSGLTIDELTLSKYATCGGAYDGRTLRRLGGYQAIVDEAFHEDLKIDVDTSRYLQKRRSYVNGLEKKLADWEYLRSSVYDGFKRAFETVGPFQVTKINKSDKPKAKIQKRANLVVISDIHLGLKIDPEEIMTNGYDWQIGARRLGKLAEQTSDFKFDHRDECPELHVCLGGDLGQGIIHMNDSGTDLITFQVIGITYYLTQMIDHWRKSYDKIFVHCTPDNHMRLTHKGPDRAMSQKTDSFATMVHFALQMGFRGVDDVVFDVPKTAITTFKVLGHKFGLTHGDTHIQSGNIGQSVNVKSIATQVMKLNATVKDHKYYDCIILGHVHVPLNMHLNETNTELVVNGTGSGTDGYAESLGFFRTKPHQVLFEVTENYAVGDFRKIALDDADHDERYEQIVSPYKHGLEVRPMFGIDYPKPQFYLVSMVELEHSANLPTQGDRHPVIIVTMVAGKSFILGVMIMTSPSCMIPRQLHGQSGFGGWPFCSHRQLPILQGNTSSPLHGETFQSGATLITKHCLMSDSITLIQHSPCVNSSSVNPVSLIFDTHAETLLSVLSTRTRSNSCLGSSTPILLIGVVDVIVVGYEVNCPNLKSG